MTDNTTPLSNEQPNAATNAPAGGTQQNIYPYVTPQYGSVYEGAPYGGYAPYPPTPAPAGVGANAALQAKNGKLALGGKTIALIAGIALACGLVGGAGGAFAVNALVGQTSTTQMEMQMPGEMDSDMGGMGGFGGQSSDGQSGQMEAPDGMSQGGSSESGQSADGQSSGQSNDGDNTGSDGTGSNSSSSDSDAGTSDFGDSSMTI